MDAPVKAKDLPDRCYFRKRTGAYVFIRISANAVKFYGLKPDHIYGICYNGNMADIEPETLVIPTSWDA